MFTRPATEMFYLVAGRTVLIDAFDEWSRRAVSEIFSGWFLSPVPKGVVSVPNATIRVHGGSTPPPIPSGLTGFQITHGGICLTDNSKYYVKFDDSLIVFGPGTSPDVELWIDKPYDLSSGTMVQLLSHALSPALRRCGLFEIHSAAVIPPHSSKAMMIAGPSGSGKSTLTSQLAGRGWQYLSDDILLLQGSADSIRIHAFRRFFALTVDTLTAMNLERPPFKGTNRSIKERVTPQDHFASSPVQEAEVATIVFPVITGEERSRVSSLSSVETMRRLLRLCPWASYDKPTSVEHLSMLGRLASGLTAFDFFAGTDLIEDPQLATGLLKNVNSQAVAR